MERQTTKREHVPAACSHSNQPLCFNRNTLDTRHALGDSRAGVFEERNGAMIQPPKQCPLAYPRDAEEIFGCSVDDSVTTYEPSGSRLQHRFRQNSWGEHCAARR